MYKFVLMGYHQAVLYTPFPSTISTLIYRHSQFDSVKVVALEEGGGAPPVAPGRDSVLNFVEQQLYHSTRYKRVPILSFQAQRYTNRPARNFA